MAAPAKRLEPVPDDNEDDNRKEQKKAPDAVEHARGEVVEGSEEKVVDWHGLKLTLPTEMPAWFMFDMTDSEVDGDPQNSFAIRSVRELIGVEQWKQARTWSIEKKLNMDAFIDLVNLVYDAYGVGPGEAESSSEPSEGGGN